MNECSDLQKKPADLFTSLPGTATMEEVVRMVAKEEGYTEEMVQQVLVVLQSKWVFTVHNLRVLSKEQIEKYGLPDVVTNYLLRVKAGEGH